jgi:hypothetical protein
MQLFIPHPYSYPRFGFPSLLRRSLVAFVVLFCCFAQTTLAVTYWWRTAAPNNVWTNVNNWSTGGFSGAPATSFPGPTDVARFGLLAETPNNITFTGIPLAGVGAINAGTLQRVITIPVGETLTIAGTGSDAGGNAVIAILGTMKILAGATVQGAGGAHRWQIGGTLEIVDDGAVTTSGMGFGPGSTLLYTGSAAKTASFEFIDGNTNLPYPGFPAT